MRLRDVTAVPNPNAGDNVGSYFCSRDYFYSFSSTPRLRDVTAAPNPNAGGGRPRPVGRRPRQQGPRPVGRRGRFVRSDRCCRVHARLLLSRSCLTVGVAALVALMLGWPQL